MARGTFIELCSGSAVTSLKLLLGERAEAPVPWLGGKKRLAGTILNRLGLHPGDGIDHLVLVDAGMWPLIWLQVQQDFEGVMAGLVRMEGSEAYRAGPEQLWRSLHAAEPPTDDAERAAVWLCLQSGAGAGKPVHVHNGAWKSAGYAGITPKAAARGYKPRPQMPRLKRLVKDMHRAIGRTDLKVIPWDLSRGLPPGLPLEGSRVLLDPPYASVRSRYPDSLSRECVLQLARACASGGADVVVCEAEPLPLESWASEDVSELQGTWCGKEGAKEWLTFSPKRTGSVSTMRWGPLFRT